MSNKSRSDLPVKTCMVCNRPFTWRKAWAKNWAEVRYCSDKCRMRKKSATGMIYSATQVNEGKNK